MANAIDKIQFSSEVFDCLGRKNIPPHPWAALCLAHVLIGATDTYGGLLCSPAWAEDQSSGSLGSSWLR